MAPSVARVLWIMKTIACAVCPGLLALAFNPRRLVRVLHRRGLSVRHNLGGE